MSTSAPPTNDDSSTDPLIGQLVDERYRIVRHLARGGMATVYVAHDERLERPVAVKVMHPHLADSPDFLERFRAEARNAARIIHPGVVSVTDQGQVGNQGFLVMELVHGQTLRSIISTEGALPLGQALDITQQLLEALGAAHRVNVIHRDIKPENVLVPAEPPVKVTDFGLARALSETAMTSTRSMLGTVSYVAPEVATTGQIDIRTDLYSVGVMLFEMVTGQVPWQGETAIQIAFHHVHHDIPAPSSLHRWIPAEIDECIAALAARDPAQRPADTAAALEILYGARAGLPEAVLARRAEPLADTTEGESGQYTEKVPFQAPTAPLPAGLIPPPSPPESSSAPTPSTHAVGTHPHGVVVATIPPPPTAPADASQESAPHANHPVPAPISAAKNPASQRFLPFIFTALILVIVLSISSLWWWGEHGPGSLRTVPNVSGLSRSLAKSTLEEQGFTPEFSTGFSDQIPSGSVISTDPDAGGQVRKSSTIHVLVSKGVDMRTVPDVTKKSADEAANALASQSLKIGTQTQEWSDTAPSGQVISQSPEPGVSIPHSTPVDVVVSKGPQPLTIPNLAGKTREEAVSAIENLGLSASVNEAHSDTVPAGQVISVSPDAGSTAYKGDTVTIQVSRGPQMVEVPQVVGMQENEAVQKLQEAGLQVEVNRVLGGHFKRVRSTNPAAGSKVQRGSVVKLTVI